jgi:diguanylate cyclase (GGDEF)-like protein/PAS domain S-box-containing protein
MSGKPTYEELEHKVRELEAQLAERDQEIARIRENERLFAAAFDGIQDGLSILDPGLTIRRVNATMNRWYAANAPLEGKKCFECYHNAAYPCTPCPTLRCLETGRPESEVIPGLPGSPVQWIELFCHPVLDERSGKTAFVVEFARDITDRKRQEDELRRKSEERAMLLESIPTQLWYLTDIETYGLVNQAHADFLGLPKESLENRRLDEFLSFEEARVCREGNKEVFRTGSRIRTEEWLYDARNARRLIAVTKTPKLDAAGEVEYVVCTGDDITELKEAWDAMRLREERYRTIIETTSSGCWQLDADEVTVDVNRGLCTILGYEKEEILGRMPFEFVDESNRQIFLQNVARTSNVVNRSYDIILTRKDGGQVHAHFDSTTLFDANGEISGSFAFVTDMTDRIAAEEALRESEEKYKKLFDTAPDAIALVDEEGRFLTVNSSMAENFGMSHQQLEGRHFREVMPADLAESRIAQGRAAIEKGGLVYFEDEREGRHLQHYYVPVSTSSGKRTFQVIARDITEQKQAEDKLNYLSFRDVLTGLYNRNFFEEEMKRLKSGHSGAVAIAICDLDGLKFINDTLGHESGDELLMRTADILRQTFRPDDVIARIGGDEFAVLMALHRDADAEAPVRRLRERVEAYNKGEPKMFLSLSIGYAASRERPADMQGLMREADNRMYREKIQREQSSRNCIVQALMKALEARDFITEGHSDRLQELALALARSVDLPEEAVNDLLLLARFHDLGKVGVSDAILFKPGPLTREEAREMRKHCEIGHRIAQSVPDLLPIADLILKHHEWWDGNGYPQGLQGEEIPLPCRILAVADAYDAMTKDRPYRRAMSHREAIAELERNAGTQFDPGLVETFIRLWPGSEPDGDGIQRK